MENIVTCIPSMIKFHEAGHGRGLRFEPPSPFILFIAIYTGDNRSLFIQITDKEKEKHFLYDSIKSVESSINMIISYESILGK